MRVDHDFPALAQLSERALNLLALVFGDADARVVVADRARCALTVALECRTIVLHPRAGLYDLALGATLLKYRAIRYEGPATRSSAIRDYWFTRQARRRLAPEARAELRRRFPGVERLPGLLREEDRQNELRMVERRVDFAPLHGAGGEDFVVGSLAVGVAPKLEITGVDDDFEWIVAALADGRIPLSTLPSLEELPFIRLPLTIATAERYPLMEEWEEHLRDAENQRLLWTLVECSRKKSIVREERGYDGRPTIWGTRLDERRLVDAVVEARAGLETKLFRKRGRPFEPVFDPRQHLALLSFDFNSVREYAWRDKRGKVARGVTVLIAMLQELGVDAVVQGHFDQHVVLPNGRPVCLHFQTMLKTIDQSFDEAFFSRLAFLLRDRPNLPGVPTCFHALACEDIATAFREIAREHDHSYRKLIWWSLREIAMECAVGRSVGFQERLADHLDRVVDQLKRELPGTLEIVPAFLPASLREKTRFAPR